MNRTSAQNRVRFRLECMDCWLAAMAAIAARAAAIPAKTPKWWVHLVGVNMRNTSDAKVIATMRRVGPMAVPGMRFLRTSTAAETTKPRIMASTANRRAMEPSAEKAKSAE